MICACATASQQGHQNSQLHLHTKAGYFMVAALEMVGFDFARQGCTGQQSRMFLSDSEPHTCFFAGL